MCMCWSNKYAAVVGARWWCPGPCSFSSSPVLSSFPFCPPPSFFPSSMVCQGVSSPPSSETVYFFTSRFCFLPNLFSPHCFYLRIVATVSSFKYNQICNVPALRGGGGFQKGVVFQNWTPQKNFWGKNYTPLPRSPLHGAFISHTSP